MRMSWIICQRFNRAFKACHDYMKLQVMTTCFIDETMEHMEYTLSVKEIFAINVTRLEFYTSRVWKNVTLCLPQLQCLG